MPDYVFNEKSFLLDEVLAKNKNSLSELVRLFLSFNEFGILTNDGRFANKKQSYESKVAVLSADKLEVSLYLDSLPETSETAEIRTMKNSDNFNLKYDQAFDYR